MGKPLTGAGSCPSKPLPVKKLLGIDTGLYTLGQNSDVTNERQEALEIADEPGHKSFNAIQLIVNFKGAHGSGQDPAFSSQQGDQRSHE